MPTPLTAELPLILAEDSWIVTLIVGIGVLAGFAVLTGAVTVVLLARDVRTFVLPHFTPPAPGERDVSLPAQVADLSERLVHHMDAEEILRRADTQDRDRRQNEMDAWRDEVREDIGTIRGSMATKADVRTVHGRIDTALARLAVGNPELRAVPPLTIPTPAEFDAATAPEWSQMTGELDVSGDVVVDMAATTLCDSAGIGAMVHLAQRTDVAGGSFSVVNVSPNVVRSVKILSLGTVLGIE